MKLVFIACCALVFSSVLVSSTVYLRSEYETDDTFKSWVKSSSKSDLGTLTLKTRNYENSTSKALYTGETSKFYHYSRKLDTPASLVGKDFVAQYVVHFEEDLDCGGGYVKLAGDLDQSKFHGDSDYSIMFGPDTCGHTSRIHLIFNVDDKNILKTEDIAFTKDKLPHLYTLHVTKDKKYVVKVDCEVVSEGTIIDNWKINPEKTILDPEDKKPSDWVDEAEIPDAEDKKPEDWDQPKMIDDPDAKQPEDWDVDTDGEWKVPQKTNPDYKGEWKPKMIKNPAYKGEWKQKTIPNPDYKEVESYAQYENIDHVGIDVWQVSAKTLFSHFYISDDIADADKVCQDDLKELKKYAEIYKKVEEKAAKEAEESGKSDDKEDDTEEETEKETDSESKDEL